MLMGRRTYEIFASLWPAQTGQYADAINAIHKYVFSSTLEDARWTNTTIVRGDVATEVAKLKHEDGKDLVLYGHGPLGQSLLENDLLDEIRFAIHPLFVGQGTRLLRDGAKAAFQLVSTRSLATGVVFVTYQPART
jgi:dihydrofolate reductase